MTLALEDVMRFMRARTKGDACFACGHNKWGIGGYGKEGFTYSIPTASVPAANRLAQLHLPAPSEAVLLLICDHCGFVRMHRYEHVRRWVELNPGAGESDADA